MTVLIFLAVSAVVAVLVVTATPLKLNPPLRHLDRCCFLGGFGGCGGFGRDGYPLKLNPPSPTS